METAALPRHHRHYPSQLELFRECRRRYRLKVIERLKVNEPFSPPLVKANVAHAVLEICCKELMESGGVPADLQSLVAPRLPRQEYPSEIAWMTDVAEVVDWVKFGLSYIDPYATILGVELFLERSYRPDGSSPVALGVVADLVLLRADRDGERYLEIIDWKTGKTINPPLYAPVMARFALKQLIARHVPGNGFVPTVFTEVYLAKQVPRTRELTLASCIENLDAVKQMITAIEHEQEWSPNPSPRCQWCPFYGNGCQPDDAEDGGALW